MLQCACAALALQMIFDLELPSAQAWIHGVTAQGLKCQRGSTEIVFKSESLFLREVVTKQNPDAKQRKDPRALDVIGLLEDRIRALALNWDVPEEIGAEPCRVEGNPATELAREYKQEEIAVHAKNLVGDFELHVAMKQCLIEAANREFAVDVLPFSKRLPFEKRTTATTTTTTSYEVSAHPCVEYRLKCSALERWPCLVTATVDGECVLFKEHNHKPIWNREKPAYFDGFETGTECDEQGNRSKTQRRFVLAAAEWAGGSAEAAEANDAEERDARAKIRARDLAIVPEDYVFGADDLPVLDFRTEEEDEGKLLGLEDGDAQKELLEDNDVVDEEESSAPTEIVVRFWELIEKEIAASSIGKTYYNRSDYGYTQHAYSTSRDVSSTEGPRKKPRRKHEYLPNALENGWLAIEDDPAGPAAHSSRPACLLDSNDDENTLFTRAGREERKHLRSFGFGNSEGGRRKQICRGKLLHTATIVIRQKKYAFDPATFRYFRTLFETDAAQPALTDGNVGQRTGAPRGRALPLLDAKRGLRCIIDAANVARWGQVAPQVVAPSGSSSGRRSSSSPPPFHVPLLVEMVRTLQEILVRGLRGVDSPKFSEELFPATIVAGCARCDETPLRLASLRREFDRVASETDSQEGVRLQLALSRGSGAAAHDRHILQEANRRDSFPFIVSNDRFGDFVERGEVTQAGIEGRVVGFDFHRKVVPYWVDRAARTGSGAEEGGDSECGVEDHDCYEPLFVVPAAVAVDESEPWISCGGEEVDSKTRFVSWLKTGLKPLQHPLLW